MCLDSIRGLAALSVLLGHLAGSFEWPELIKVISLTPYLNIPFDGKLAVALFFVLSGFVLSLSYMNDGERPDKERSICIPAFYARRVVRIWVPWAFVFLLSVIAQKTIHQIPTTHPPVSTWSLGFWNQPQTVESVIKQSYFALHDARLMLLPQDWSLGVELKGSAFVPFLIIVFRKSFPAMVLATLALYFLIDTGNFYVSFSIGVMSAGLYRSARWLGFFCKKSVQYVMLFVGIFLYGSCNLVEHFSGYNRQSDKFFWCLSSLSLIHI